MYAVIVTLKSGATISGILNGRTVAHVRAIVHAADSGRDVADISVTPTW
jgi:hypothetical protein